MKRRFYYMLFAYIVTAVLLSCSDPIEDDVDNTIVLNAVELLIAPADKTVLALSDDSKSTEKFEWQHAEASKGMAPKYEIIFFKDNQTPSNAISSMSASTSNSVNINHVKLNDIAAKAGIEPGSSGTIKWTIRAYHESVTALSQETNTLVIQRPEPERPVTALYLTGQGTEFGENIAEAMAFIKISDTQYILFSKLTAGQPFRFIDNIEGDKIRTFYVENNKLVEEDGDAQISKSGVYKITIDITSGLVKMKEITDLSLYYCIKHRAINLQYEGRGKWKTVSLIHFSQESWGDETRYKFKMTEGSVNNFLEKSNDGQFSMKQSVISDHDQQLWDGVWSYANNLKNRWAAVTVDMSNYTHSIEPVAEDFGSVGTSWAGHADRSSSDFVDGYWSNTRKHFNNSTTGTVNQYDYWPEAHAIDVIIDAYLRNGNNQYKQIIYDFYEGVKKKNGNTFKNSFYDDMAWHGLAHLRAFEATNDTRYEESAGQLWNWILVGWDDNTGGIKWNDQPGSTPGVPSTGPATIIGVRRWVKYGKSEINDGLNNLEWAKKMYDWMRVAKHDPATGGVYDDFENRSGAWTYNTGTFLGSAIELYDVTGENGYLEDAIRTADWTLENLSIATESNRILSDWAEQEDHDVNLFKGIFIRYFTQLIMHPDLPPDKREKYIQFIEYNAKVLLTYATDNKNSSIYNYGWYFKPKNSFLRGQTSGCTLIEALALLEKKGFV
ncbi:MAG: SusE domain-containing protein [Proteiniphilum sp.]|nr:SusE domain-containing protein [Proteiniphilum sp.]